MVHGQCPTIQVVQTLNHSQSLSQGSLHGHAAPLTEGFRVHSKASTILEGIVRFP